MSTGTNDNLPELASSWSTAVVRINAIIEAAESLPEITSAMGAADSFRHAVKKAGYGLDIQNRFAELRLRAERQAGEMLPAVIRPRSQGRRSKVSVDTTLSELGISRDQSSAWQRLASIPKPDFDSHIKTVVNSHGELTTAGLLRLARPEEPHAPAPSPPVSAPSPPSPPSSPPAPTPKPAPEQKPGGDRPALAPMKASDRYSSTAAALGLLADEGQRLDPRSFLAHKDSDPADIRRKVRAVRVWADELERLIATKLAAGRA
jgi:hypothetical protein